MSLVACRGPGEPRTSGLSALDTAPGGGATGVVSTPAAPETVSYNLSVDATPPTNSDLVTGGATLEAGPAPEREGVKPRRVRLIEHRGPATSPILYRVVEPDDAVEDTPLVLALHGRGDTAAGFVALARRLELDARVFVLEAPLPFGNIGGRQWFDAQRGDLPEQFEARLRELDGLVADLMDRHPRAGRPAVLGFSQGAMLGLVAARDHPGLFSAVVALSGRFVVPGEGVPGKAPPVLVVAGTKDGIVPQASSWEAATSLEALGRPVERFSFQGPHTVPDVVVERARLFLTRTLTSAPAPESP